ncbi:hypothetical protein P8625_06870 [Tenacibaculum tangerinum]|uniref:Plantaricin C family lantibiotic n=1 Tax=Tenacibaculum tangerinum TaxID=3038772 RepID=A0ABY8L9P0_9FLAO|nr:hypothetical protein [Tenacibaculum tangerinum]WGH76858.1 hypothetical protein P8625_06870 [Tenacibaculum tangerinum]
MKKSILDLGKVISKAELQQINGSVAVKASFDCYCNGKYVGKASSISECWNMCPSQIQ